MKAKWSVTVVFVLAQVAGLNRSHAGGLVAAWGADGAGQTSLPAGVNSVKAIAAGWLHGLALKADGTVVTWGYESDPGLIKVPPGLTRVVAVAAGSDWSMALKADGTVSAWGTIGHDWDSDPLSSLSNVTAIAAGWDHWLALKSDGSLATYGFGIDSYNPDYPTHIPPGLSNIVAIAAGNEFSVVLKADGTVVTWGSNAFPTNVPPGLSNVVAIATSCAASHVLALKDDGTVVGWGGNWGGQTDVPVGLSNVVAIAAGEYHSLALKADGTVVGWGANGLFGFPDYGQATIPRGLANVRAISAGGEHSLALVFGDPVQITQNPSPQSQRLAFGANVTYSVGATGAGTLSYQWLLNGFTISNNARIRGATNATLTITNLQISDMGTYTVVVSSAFGSVISSGATLVVISPPFITEQPSNRIVRAGSDVTLTAGVNGTPPLWYRWNFNGTNFPWQSYAALYLPNVEPAASGQCYLTITNRYGSTQTLTASLTVTDSAPYILLQPSVPLGGGAAYSFTTNFIVPVGGSVSIYFSARGSLPVNYQWRHNGVDIPDATNATLILSNLGYSQTGYYTVEVGNAFGVTNSAKLFLNVTQVIAWGAPPAFNTNMPVGLSNVIALAAGDYHLTALKADGTPMSWMADGDYVFTPVAAITNVPASATNVIAVAAGRDFSLALRSNGTIVAWGGNSYRQTNVPAGLSNVIAVAASDYRSYAVRANGTVVGWGSSPAVPGGLSNVVALACSPLHTVALQRDGTVTARAGDLPPGNAGLTNVPVGLTNVIALAASWTHSLALKQDGTVASWGDRSAPSVPGSLSNVVAIAAGTDYGLALRADGSLVEWGRYSPAMVRGLSNVIAIAALNQSAAAAVGNGSPALTLQPRSQTVPKGATLQLHARAAGVQPTSYQWQFENQDLPSATNGDLLIPNAQGKDTGGYRVVVSNALGAITSRVAWLAIPFNTNLAAALNTNDWEWVTGRREPPWFAQNRETYDGEVAAQSGAITNNQQTTLSTGISGPGTLRFWWKVSSEEGFDFLRFYVDDLSVPMASISGETDWQPVSVHLAPGNHVFHWIYSKDATVSAGQDAGWLDEVVFTPQAPLLLSAPQLLADGGVLFAAGPADGAWLPPDASVGWEVQTSTDLVNWLTLNAALTLTNGVLEWRDTARFDSRARFYRLIGR